MSGKEQPGHDWAVMEASHWQDVRVQREREDASLNHEYTQRQDSLRRVLISLYDRKSQLQNELASVDSSIKMHETEQERLAQDWEEKDRQLATLREGEDRANAEWFARRRADGREKENALPKSSDPYHSRELPPPANSGGWTSINGGVRQPVRRRENDAEPPPDPGNLLSSIYHNPVEEKESPTSRAIPLRASTTRSRPGTASNGIAPLNGIMADTESGSRSRDRPLKPKSRHSLPGFATLNRSPTTNPPVADIPFEPKTRSPSGRKSLPTARSTGSVAPSTDTPASENITDGKEITRESLVFGNDGSTLTGPDLFAGVPLQKIDEQHPYWHPEWDNLEGIIQPALDKWKEKLDALRRDPDAVRHTVFLANRQVNRGQTIVDFLKAETTPFHPYQFVAKDIMIKFYKTFVNYDTMFRLANVHEELKKFDLDVSPLEWLRQRMFEVSEAQGDKFNLSKTTHNLYHDAKLKVLREKHGYGNIGRPSGYKVGEKSSNRLPRKTKRESGGLRGRKGRRSTGHVEGDDTSTSMEGVIQQEGYPAHQGEYLEPVTPRMSKRPRLEPQSAMVVVPEKDNFEYDGYTSTDSFSAGRIMHLDFRVYQIKTRNLTTSPDVTQYWTWKPEPKGPEGGMFEHQVLRDVHPKVTWGLYQQSDDFNLALREIREIQWAQDSQKVIVMISDGKRGDVVGYFKRKRTKLRFLAFARKKGVQLVEATTLHIEKIWDSMESETMANDGSD
ncbi:hypothetical protein F5Y15DRAFT_134606 [Xylariaceae sp. FL0016]|nr:hypothetical protein F5Y15DRAFT_134606 [Xylariaceae sp. FL0016]